MWGFFYAAKFGIQKSGFGRNILVFDLCLSFINI
jgi:hypothetical protein